MQHLLPLHRILARDPADIVIITRHLSRMAPTVTASQDAVKIWLIGSEEQMLTTAHVWSTRRCLTGARAEPEVSNCHSCGTWCWWGQQEMEVSGGKCTHVTGPSLIECWLGRRIIAKKLRIYYVILYWFILTYTTKHKELWNTRNNETQGTMKHKEIWNTRNYETQGTPKHKEQWNTRNYETQGTMKHKEQRNTRNNETQGTTKHKELWKTRNNETQGTMKHKEQRTQGTTKHKEQRNTSVMYLLTLDERLSVFHCSLCFVVQVSVCP